MKNSTGVTSLAKGIAANRHLLYLSLSNCSLDFDAGKELWQAVKANDVIIHTDLTNIHKLILYDVWFIQDKLKKK